MHHSPSYAYFTLFWTLLYLSCSSQTGPAGVGTNSTNALWLKANAGTSATTNSAAISSWSDQSGNGINASQATAAQQPLYRTNIMNGMPAIEFDNNNSTGQNDFLTAPDNAILDNTPGYTFFNVIQMKNLAGEARCIVSKRTSIDVDEAFMLFLYTSNAFFVDIDGLGDRFATSNTYVTATNYIMDVVYDGSLSTSTRVKVYEGETLRRTAGETSSTVPNKTSPLNIGCTHSGDPRPFAGYIAEIIIYRTALNKASRIIVNNYLSAKYNIPLSAADKYAGDAPANGNYDWDVAGIGSDSVGTVVGSNGAFASSVAAGLGITSVSGLDAGDYILAGHASPTNMQINTDVSGMSGTNNARWSRVWYMDVTNTGTDNSVNIEFDMSDGGVGNVTPGTTSDYVLLFRAAQSGSWTELSTASSITGDKVKFDGYTLTADGYYTIGTHNWSISPLPVELTAFTGEQKTNATELNWQSATESNNAYYTLGRSADGMNFEPLVQLISKAPKGNSLQPLHYTYMDTRPLKGMNYYRLAQTDLSGIEKKYSVIAVDFNEANDAHFIVYPNPGCGEFHVDLRGVENNHEIEVQLLNLNGQVLYETKTDVDALRGGAFHIIPAQAPAPGEYIVRFTMEGIYYPVRVVVDYSR